MLEVVAPYGNRGVGKDKACECAVTRKTSVRYRDSSVGRIAVSKTEDMGSSP